MTGISKMARFEITDMNNSMIAGEVRADILCDMGLMYATGRDCKIDMIAAHKWFNIAAIKGSTRAAALRAELTDTLTKSELAKALREAREWMTMH